MAYNELVKNYEKVRAYMREFYVYGFKSRNEYDRKSARSYDDEKRRIESWLGDYMRFTQTAEGKTVFLSVDSRITQKNPFYKTWKAKSFTDGDITLHFILFDILYEPKIKKTLTELSELISEALFAFEEPMNFDESTIRKKLKEYVEEGLICVEKEGKKSVYSRTEGGELTPLEDVIDFFSECSPCGVIGSFLQDKTEEHENPFFFKHHYMTGAIDSDVMACLFDAIHEKRRVTVDNLGRNIGEVRTFSLVPLKIYISAQNGRQHLIAYHEMSRRLGSYRLDYMSNIRKGEVCAEFDRLKEALAASEPHIWGVSCSFSPEMTERVEFELYVGEEEGYIIRRLEREKRCGSVEKIDDNHYRYCAEVFDSNELIPWIRTFICRITKMNFSNRTVENRFKNDLLTMYRMYGLEEGGDVLDLQ